jgi:homeobox protein cut-like
LQEQTASLQDLESLRTQHAALQSETSALRTRLAGLSSLEAERTRLSDKVASLEKGFEARVAERTSSLEASLSARWEERVQNLVSREKDLSRALEVAQSQLKELRAAHAQATEREVAGAEKDARVEELEMQMAADDLRRANERIADLERRNESLRSEVIRAQETSGEEERQAEWERKVEESQEEARRLAAALEGEDARSKRLIEEEKRRCEEKERALGERVKEVEVLRKRIEGMQDYDEIKRELQIIKYVEFAVQDGADGPAAQEVEGSAASAASGAKPLEALLIEKNRKLQDEATTMRVEHEALSKGASASAKQLAALQAEVERLRALNVRLEDDLVNFDTARPSTSQARDKSSMSAEEALAEMDRIGQAAGVSCLCRCSASGCSHLNLRAPPHRAVLRPSRIAPSPSRRLQLLQRQVRPLLRPPARAASCPSLPASATASVHATPNSKRCVPRGFESLRQS